ncbi:MAG: hypothetical protein HS111_32885 [Kofleriaceae bacterium]|nr:hypothetical protein [Kofleriaceae bacterium]
MRYLPSLLAGMTRRQEHRLVTYRVRILYWGLTELRLVKDDFETLGIDPRAIIGEPRKKQLAALGAAYEAVGIPFDRDRNWAAASLNAAVELLFPPTPAAVTARARAAWDAFWRRNQPGSLDVFAPHQHAIRTARGQVASAGE